MSHTPPVPEASQSPFPRAEPPHVASPVASTVGATATQASDAVQSGVAAEQDAVGPLVEKAKTFARERPYATAALVGTIGLALFNSLRGKSVK